MKLMSIKEYAIVNKLSIYNVVKMVKNGTLQSEIKKVDGKDEVYVIQNEISSIYKGTPDTSEAETIGDYEKAYFELKLKYDQLKIEHEALKKRVETL